MLTDTKPAPSLDPAAALSSILALAQTAAVTADDAGPVAREQSVIDRAREVLTRRANAPSASAGGRAPAAAGVRRAR